MGWSLHAPDRLLIDFSIRHPDTLHCSSGQDVIEVAKREKDAHYPSRQGLQVHAAVMEIFGRHGDGLVALLEKLADRARLRERTFGSPPTRWLRKWRVQSSAIAVRMVGGAMKQVCPTGTNLCA